MESEGLLKSDMFSGECAARQGVLPLVCSRKSGGVVMNTALKNRQEPQWFVDWSKIWSESPRPQVGIIRERILQFLGGAGEVEMRPGMLIVKLPGRPHADFELFLYHEMCGRTIKTEADRWILIEFVGDKGISVKCCLQDRYCTVIANELAALVFDRIESGD